MEFLTDIKWISPFPILGLIGGIFHSKSIQCTINQMLKEKYETIWFYGLISSQKD